MPVRTVDHLERHGNRALKRIKIAAGRVETAFAVEGNKLERTAGRTAVHSTTEGRIAAVNHAVDILHNDRASLQGILDFLMYIPDGELRLHGESAPLSRSFSPIVTEV